MVNSIITAKMARRKSFESSKDGQRVLNILDAIQDNIEKACDKGVYCTSYTLGERNLPLKTPLVYELTELGFDVTVSGMDKNILKISW